MGESIRAFVAVALPREIRSFLETVQGDLRAAGIRARWVRPEGIHLTLKFLGDIPPGSVPAVGEAVAEAAAGRTAPVLESRGVGVFPGIRRPRVLWVGIAGDTGPLTEIRDAVEERLAAAGFPAEPRPFRAHLTLARFREPPAPDRLADALHRWAEVRSPGFSADRVTVFRSDLHPAGARYTELVHIPLSQRQPRPSAGNHRRKA